MTTPQPGILADVPRLARYLTFRLRLGADPRAALIALKDRGPLDASTVVGLGEPLVRALGSTVDGLRSFPAHVGDGFSVPSTPADLWIWLHGDDRGTLLHTGRALTSLLADAFDLDLVIDAFQFEDSRDLSGYVDGTENPTGEDAVAAGVLTSDAPGMGGSSFVAVQQWVHDLDHFQGMAQEERDNIIGRRLSDNEEIEDAPVSAHVKRTAQEDFEPEAFVVRRSMPWADADRHGLVFVAFGRSFDAFEAQLRRMVGLDDGIADALFRFTRPITGSFFWCPPLIDERLDLRAIGL